MRHSLARSDGVIEAHTVSTRDILAELPALAEEISKGTSDLDVRPTPLTDVGQTSTPAVDRDLVAEAPRTVGRADEIDLRQRGRPFLLRLPESADGGNP